MEAPLPQMVSGCLFVHLIRRIQNPCFANDCRPIFCQLRFLCHIISFFVSGVLARHVAEKPVAQLNWINTASGKPCWYALSALSLCSRTAGGAGVDGRLCTSWAQQRGLVERVEPLQLGRLRLRFLMCVCVLQQFASRNLKLFMFGTACGERFWWKGTAQWTALIYLGMAWVFGNWLSCFWARVLRTPQNYHKIVLACVIYAMGLWAENFASRETSFGEMAFSFLCYFGWLSGGVPRAGWSLLKDSHLNSLPPNPWQVLRCTSHSKNASICTCDFECSLLWLLWDLQPKPKTFWVSKWRLI